MSEDPDDFGAFLEKTVAADPELSEAVAIAEKQLEAESMRQRLQDAERLHHSRDRLGEALQLLEAAKDALPSDDMVYLRIREFLDQE